MEIIKKILTSLDEAVNCLVGNVGNVSVENSLIAIAAILIPALIWFSVAFPLKKSTKLTRGQQDAIATAVTIGVILIFFIICILTDL